jgi:signal transduction histidine kinase/ligand-binding sensor domain-containing protein
MIKIIFTVFTAFSLIYCQQRDVFDFRNISVEYGLSSISVNSILQDRKGFIWLGTEDGLNRYDGYDFKVYRNDPDDSGSLSNNYIWSICEDSSGNIWVGTEGGGLNKFDPVSEIFFRYTFNPEDASSLSSNIVQYVYTDHMDNVWAGTWGSGLNLYNKKNNSFIRYNSSEEKGSISNNKIFCIYQDSKRNLWVGTDGGGLNQYIPHSNTFETFRFDHSGSQPKLNAISKIIEGKDGTLWIGTFGGGVINFNSVNGSTKIYSAGSRDGSLSGNYIWDIAVEKSGNLWFATQSRGLSFYSYKENKFTSFNKSNSPVAEQVKSLFIDKSEVLWIGTLTSGIFTTDRKKRKFNNMSSSNPAGGLPENFVLAIMQDRYSDIWIGSYNYITRYSPSEGKFYSFNLKKGTGNISGAVVRSIFEDSESEIWVGTYFGHLNKFNRKSGKFENIDLNIKGDNPDANTVRAIFEDNKGHLWFCSNGGGIVKLDKKSGSYTVYRADSVSGLTSDYVISAAEDKYGNLWFGTQGGGLNKFDRSTGKFARYNAGLKPGTPSITDVVPELFIDSQGRLWIGTSKGGLCLYDYAADSLIVYSEKNGLISNSVYGILEDDKQNLWVSTSKGIAMLNTSTGTLKNYDVNHGLIRGEFNPSSKAKTADGWIYFGGIEGINYFHPDSIVENSYIPPVEITSFTVLNSDFKLPVNTSYIDTIVLAHNQNEINFDFAALDYTNPSQNSYAYKIKGIDENWNYIGNRRSINFTRLSPGKYKIIIKGSNNDGIWNNAGKELLLIITPPFWATWWAYVVYISLFGILLVSIREYELKRRRKREKENLMKEKAAHEEFSRRLLKSQEEERKRIASELHDSLGQNLLIIKNRAVLATRSTDPEFSRLQLNDISSGASSAIEEVRRISYNLHPHHLDNLGLTKSIRAMIDNLESTTSIRFTFDSDNIDHKFDPESEINFFRIIQECVNNIVKHSEADKSSVIIKSGSNSLSVTISDNGKGFDPENNSLPDAPGGFGLKNLQKRAAILKGEFVIDSVKDKGTTIKLNIPVYE